MQQLARVQMPHRRAAAAVVLGAHPGLSGCEKQVCSVHLSHVSCPFAGQFAATKICQAVCSLLPTKAVGNVQADDACGWAAGAAGADAGADALVPASGVADVHASCSQHTVVSMVDTAVTLWRSRTVILLLAAIAAMNPQGYRADHTT
jgi:hypothetical protein